MAKARSLSNATALRDETVLRRGPASRQRSQRAAGMAAAAPDRARSHPARPLFRSLDSLARHIRPRCPRSTGSRRRFRRCWSFSSCLPGSRMRSLVCARFSWTTCTRAPALLAGELLVRAAAVILAGASVLAVLKLFLGR